MKHALIGQLLVDRGVVDEKTVNEAVRLGGRLCSRLLEMRACDERDLVSVLADKHGVPGVDLSRTVIPASVLRVVPRAVAEADTMLPLSVEGERLHLAVPSPSEGGRAIAEVRFVTGREVSPYIALSGSLKRAIAEAYDALERGQASWRGWAAGPSSPPRIASESPQGEPLEVSPDDLVTIEAEPEAEVPAQAEVVVQVEEDEPLGRPAAQVGPKRVLVVDDEPEIQLLVQRALERSGYAVETAGDGQEALDKVGSWRPDLLLLDAMLPRLHGFEVCRRVKSNPQTRDLPVVMMTAVYRGWRFANDARETYGAQDYLEKPFHVAELLRRVAEALHSAAPAGSSAEPLVKKGKDLLAAGKVEEALGALGKAVEADPFSADAHHLLAKAQRAHGDVFQAMSSFERAVELRPNLFQALRSLAALYVETGFRRKAAEVLERALQSAPDEQARETLKRELLKLL